MDAILINLLQQLASQDPNILKAAEAVIQQYTEDEGFHSSLLNIFFNRSNDLNVRWLAIIYFKNGVDQYWRNSKSGKVNYKPISDAEKEYIRQQLLSDFNEPIRQLGGQLALAIGRIARVESTETFTFLPALIEAVKSDNPVVKYQAYTTLFELIKSVSSIIFFTDRIINVLHEICVNMFKDFVSLWNTHMQTYFMLMSANEINIQEVKREVEYASCALRILRKLIRGYCRDPNISDIHMFLELILEHADKSIECRHRLVSRSIHFEECDKIVTSMTKILLFMQDSCFDEIFDYMPRIIAFSVNYCFTDEGQSMLFEKLNINCLRLLKMDEAPVGRVYSITRNQKKTKSLRVTKMIRLLETLIPPEKMREICIRFITRYLILTPLELEQWDYILSPNDVSEGAQTFSLKACIVDVFLYFSRRFPTVFRSTLIELMKAQCQPLTTDDLSAILLKDAVYNAVGLLSMDIYEQINFEEWLHTTLLPELKLTGANSKIIRKRIYWLIGKWLNVESTVSFQGELYKLLADGFTQEVEMEVRLAICFGIQIGLQTFRNMQMVYGYMKATFAALFQLLKDNDDADIKLRILSVFIDVVTYFGDEIKAAIEDLIMYLPVLWQEYDNHYMLRCSVVTLAMHIVMIVRSTSISSYSIFIGLVHASCDVNQEGHVYYLEDGLNLWWTMLQYAPNSTPELMSLLQHIPMLIERAADNLELILNIIHAYILLDPVEFNNRSPEIIVEALHSIINDLLSDGLCLIMSIIKAYMITCPNYSVAILKPLLKKPFEVICWPPENDFTFPNTRICTLVTARLLLCSQDIFIQVIMDLAHKHEMNNEDVLVKLTTQWLNYLKNIGITEDKKLMSLAFCVFLSPTTPEIVFANFSLIMTTIVETLNDIDSEETDYVLEFDLEINPDTIMYDGSEHDRRTENLSYIDPIMRISLKNTLQSQLMGLKESFGDQWFQELMLTVDPDTREQLNYYINLNPENDLNTML